MRHTLLSLWMKHRTLLIAIREDHGQDLVEYAAVISLIVLGITSSMTTLASGINSAMGLVSNNINTIIG